MATTLPQRRPLETRSIQSLANKSNRVASGSKRARSPTHGDHPSPKRPRATEPEVQKQDRKEKKDKHAEHEAREREMAAEFRRKYRKAFPEFTFFFFGLDPRKEQVLRASVEKYGGKVNDFFSAKMTHLVTSQHPNMLKSNKENGKRRGDDLLSPIRLINRGVFDQGTEDVIAKAQTWGLKIWGVDKLESVLHRCADAPVSRSIANARTARTQNLSALLDHEKYHGTTERDPTQKRHDWKYFKPGSYFVLLEDIRGELATLAAHEYPSVNPKKDKDVLAKKPWPVLHCHPHARNPFVPFDEKEKRRYEKQLAAEKEQEEDDEKRREKKRIDFIMKRKLAAKQNKGGNDLRRTASVNNIRRRYSHPVAGQHGGAEAVDLEDDLDDDEQQDFANASGCTASNTGAYIAASGNSVGITSATGTTSTSQAFSNNRPTVALDRFGRHVVTNLKFPARDKENQAPAGSMGPPSKLPAKQHLIKRSKSTNTLRLPKREEGAKPGYCESCRTKFDDFSEHVLSSKHKKFASNPANYRSLDEVLSRLQRKTKDEVVEEELAERLEFQHECKLNRREMRLRTRNRELSSP